MRVASPRVAFPTSESMRKQGGEMALGYGLSVMIVEDPDFGGRGSLDLWGIMDEGDEMRDGLNHKITAFILYE